MKKLLFIPLVCLSLITSAKNYYLSAKGNDNNNGLSASAPWLSIAKLNASFGLISPGDSILFKCGESFFGSVTCSKSGAAGNPIVISSYGVGDKPVITGFTLTNGWTNIGSNLWQSAPIPAYKPNMVLINGVPTAMGRYPNAGSPNGGYATFTSCTGNTSITDPALSAIPNFTGGEVIIRKYHWFISRDSITNHSGNVINYNGTSGYNSTNGFGYFIQNSLSTLDQQNEWYYNNSNKTLILYSSSAPLNVNMATVDTLINTKTFSNITIENLALTGSNGASIGINTGGRGGTAVNISIRNCSINFSGRDGIYATNSNNLTVDKCDIYNSYNNGVICNSDGGYSNNVAITNNKVVKSGVVAGMSYGGAANSGISVFGDNAFIKGNTVDSSGYNGVQFFNNNSKVKNNFITNFCSVKDDGGGIYTYNIKSGFASGREVTDNIVLNGIGAGYGTKDGNEGGSVQGIYIDDASTGVSVARNTIANMPSSGIYLHNVQNIDVSQNTMYNNTLSQLLVVHDDYAPLLPTRNVNVTNNILFSASLQQSQVTIRTTKDDLDSMGLRDSNYYALPVDDVTTFQTSKKVSSATVDNVYYSLDSWKSGFPKQDLHSKKSMALISKYTVLNLVTLNSVKNGQFSSDISNVTTWSSNGAQTATWDNSNKITGGTFKIQSSSLSNTEILVYAPVGAVASSKNYILKFSTLGTLANCSIKAYLRSTAPPYSVISNVQIRNFSTSRVDHEILISNPTTDPNASYVFEILQSSGTVYIDNIEFYEANVSLNSITNNVRFEYNASSVDKQVQLDAVYLGVDSAIYNGSITLKPYSSAILIKSGPLQLNLKADAGTDISLILPNNTTTLKGSAIGQISKYQWTKIAGPNQYSIANPASPSTGINGLTSGRYTFQFKVFNISGDSALSIVNIIVTGALPVKLIDFKAQNINDKIYLNWQVASEINSSHYTIERSSNGEQFESIGQINSFNLADIKVNYEFNDNFPLKGINYYRLVMVDKDGTFSYSKTVSSNIKSAPSFLLSNIHLSEKNSSLHIIVNSNYQQNLQIMLCDVNGRIHYQSKVNIQKGVNQIEKNFSNCARGVYFVNVKSDDLQITKSILSN